jgi:hypothetical protein
MNTAHKNPALNPANGDSGNRLPAGTRLGDFEIKDVIGEGGFGIVYLAFDHALQRTVAIKEYMPEALAGRGADKSVVIRSERHLETFETGLKGFIQEARLLARFDHPALIKVHRFWEQNNTGYMAMRYYEGRTLKEIMKNDSALLTEAWLKSMLKSILEALDALYAVQILHRDISPDNIMIQRNGEAVLLDFGAARQIIGDITQALTVILKPGYAPIEQYADDTSMKQGPWTDIYALSAVVYAAIAGKPPPTSVARMIRDPIEPLQDGSHAGFSPAFLRAIDQGLAVRPERRPQSIAVFRQMLDLDANISAQADAPPACADTVASSAANSAEAVGNATQASVPHKQAKEKASATASRAVLISGLLAAVAIGGYRFISADPKPAAPAKPASASARAPNDPPPASVVVPAIPPVAPEPPQRSPSIDDETMAWQALRDAEDTKPEDLAQFIRRYPSGKHLKQASEKLRAMSQKRLAAGDKADGADGPDTTEKADAAQSAPDPAAVPPPVTGLVQLVIKPWGKVMVDGVSLGVSPPLKRLTLAEGRHQLTIVNPNFPAYATEIIIDRKKSSYVYHDFYPVQNKYPKTQ